MICSVTYNEITKKMVVCFGNGARYTYFCVDAPAHDHFWANDYSVYYWRKYIHEVYRYAQDTIPTTPQEEPA